MPPTCYQTTPGRTLRYMSFIFKGASMATPAESGAAVVLLQQVPDLNPV